jgi:hypothetical protein
MREIVDCHYHPRASKEGAYRCGVAGTEQYVTPDICRQYELFPGVATKAAHCLMENVPEPGYSFHRGRGHKTYAQIRPVGEDLIKFPQKLPSVSLHTSDRLGQEASIDDYSLCFGHRALS